MGKIENGFVENPPIGFSNWDVKIVKTPKPLKYWYDSNYWQIVTENRETEDPLMVKLYWRHG